jgi:hypothetical protein
VFSTKKKWKQFTTTWISEFVKQNENVEVALDPNWRYRKYLVQLPFCPKDLHFNKSSIILIYANAIPLDATLCIADSKTKSINISISKRKRIQRRTATHLTNNFIVCSKFLLKSKHTAQTIQYITYMNWPNNCNNIKNHIFL